MHVFIRFNDRRWQLLMAFAVLMVASCHGNNATDKTPPGEVPATAGDSTSAPGVSYDVPQGDVVALSEFIDQLRAFKPGDTMEMLEHERKSRPALLEAAREILSIEKDVNAPAYRKAAEIVLVDRVNHADTLPAEEHEQVLDELVELFHEKKQGSTTLTPHDFSTALILINVLDRDDGALAVRAYREFAELFRDNPDEEVREMATLLDGAVRRLELPGTAMELTGMDVTGNTFDLATLKGKVVLVDFWATWCAPCVAEHVAIKELYEKYHDLGFEVVGISLDVDREKLDNYLQRNSIPWITVAADGAEQNPAYTRYGIMAVPVMILVGRDGKVISIDARGAELKRLLAREFAATKKTPSSG